MRKNRIASIVLLYVLISVTFSFIPILAQSSGSSDIIKSILDESKSQVEQKITKLQENGITIPSSASTFYNNGLTEYDAALASLNSGNLDEARDHALEAMSLFEDAIKALFEAEEDFQDEQEAVLNEIFELGETIANSESDADELRGLASINNLDVSFSDFDGAIAEALRLLAEGDLAGARQQYNIAQDLLAAIYDLIHAEANSNVDQRAQEFVANTITQLNAIIIDANELGVSPAIIDQLQDIIDDLQNAGSTDEIIGISDQSSALDELISENPEWIEEDYKIEVEVKNGKAKIKIELGDEKYRFVLTDDPTEEEIIAAIVDKTGLEPFFITSIWDFKYEGGSDVRLKAELVDDGDDFGKADFRLRGASGDTCNQTATPPPPIADRCKLSVEIEDMDVLGFAVGKVFNVFVNNGMVGTITLQATCGDDVFCGDLNLDTDDVAVPTVLPDQSVQVKDGSTVVLSGIFAPHHGSEEEETEIEVEVEGGSAEVKVEFGGQEFEFVVPETDETAIANAIAGNQDLLDAGFTLSASDIMGIWDFEVEEEEVSEHEK